VDTEHRQQGRDLLYYCYRLISEYAITGEVMRDTNSTSIGHDLLEVPRFGQLLDRRRDRLGLLVSAARACGDVVGLKFGTREFYLLVHPDAIQHVLVTNHRNYHKGPDHIYLKPMIGDGLITSEGEAHLQQRRMLQPAFHHARIAAYATAMTSYTTEMLDGWRHGATVDLSTELMSLTRRIVTWVLYGVDIDDDGDPFGPRLRAALAQFNEDQRGLLPNTRRAVRDLDTVTYALIAQRRAAGETTGDLLSMLLAMRRKTPGAPDAPGAPLTDQQIRDEIMTLFFAGHETTAAALTWSWYLLAQHPDAMTTLRDELDAVLGARPPTVDDLPLLRYTTMVFAEALRLFPSVWSITRTSVAEDRIGPYPIPAGMPVMISPYITHRDARFYPDPDRFDPTRFDPDHDVRKQLPRFAYVPFGGGPRQCMGESFGWMEGTLLLATMAQRYRMRLAPDHEVVPHALITLRPKDGVRVVLDAISR